MKNYFLQKKIKIEFKTKKALTNTRFFNDFLKRQFQRCMIVCMLSNNALFKML
jgi:hypothetical protein